MATISSYDSSSMSVLLSSLSTSSSSSSSSDILGISYSDYASIQNGSYYKLMKAYYATTSSTSTSGDSTATIAAIEDSAEDLVDSASKLLEKGSDSVFAKVTTTDEDGNTVTDYDVDAIYDAVNQFIEDYNTLLDTTIESDSTNILRTTSNLVNYTDQYESLLNSVGITIDSDNKLSIDEETFKSADMATVKTLFQSTGFFAYQVSAKASTIYRYAQNEAAKSNTYSSSATYTYNYTTGELYSSEA